MKRSTRLLLLTGMLIVTMPAFAADQVVVAPPPHAVAVPPPLLLPPCREAFFATSLYCVPRADVYAPQDPYLHSYLRSLRPVQRKPYMQVFTW
jgi:hypothetical protein